MNASQTTFRRKRHRIWVILFLAIGLLLSVACGLIGLVLIATPERLSAIPATGPPGSDVTTAQTPTPTAQPHEPPNALAPFISPTPQSNYRGEAGLRLEACYLAFHQLFMLEDEILIHPDLAGSEAWETQVNEAGDRYREACSKLGNLPDAPSPYAEADEWFKKAAAEVPTAADTYTQALLTQDDRTMYVAIEHLITFMEYTRLGEKALQVLDDLRDI